VAASKEPARLRRSLTAPAGRRSLESLLHERKTIDRLVEMATQPEAAEAC